MKSLWGRLALGMGLSLLLLFFIQWGLSHHALHLLTDDFVVSRLDHDAENLLGALRRDENGRFELNPARINGIYHQPFSGHYYIVEAGGQRLYSRSLWDFELALPAIFGHHAYVKGPEGQRLLTIERHYRKKGEPVRIVVAEDIAPLDDNLDAFLVRYVLAAFLMIVAVIAIQGMLVRSGLRPLKRVEEELERLERGERLRLSEEVPTEVRPLVRRFNQLLDVMKGQLERSRTAMGNLAHALKTPLTVLTRLLDAPEFDRHPELRNEMARQLETIGQLTERQLKRARLAAVGAPGGRFEPARELAELAGVLERIHAEKGVRIALEIPESLQLPADREDMLELFGNLLDNACKWARREVRVTARVEDDWVELAVEDDGPGCPEPQHRRLVERGVRADESTAGHGLGLAIVREIVEHYGGRLELGASATLGGFRAAVALPLRAPVDSAPSGSA